MQQRIFQNSVLMLLTVVFCSVSIFAQSANQVQKVFTFDKLQKTIVPLHACSQPNVKIDPALASYKLETINGKYALVFDKPVSAGLYAIMLTNGATTEKIEWRVLPSELESKAQKFFANTKVYYGYRIGDDPTDRESAYIGQNMRLLTDELPSSQFFIRTTFDGVVQPFERFRERFIGRTRIPASVKTVKWEVVWEYPPTKEEIVLCSRETEPLQLPPDIEFISYNSRIWRKDIPSVSNKGLDTSFQIAIRGIQVDAEVGFDADNTDPDGSKSIKATLNDVKASEEVRLDYSSTKLQLYNGDEPNPYSTWVADSSTFYVISGVFDKSDGNFPITIQVKRLPRLDITELRGDIALKVKASIWNEKAGKSGVAETTLSIPLSVLLNMRHIGLSDIATKGKEKKGKSK
jgi:hypothetical protein